MLGQVPLLCKKNLLPSRHPHRASGAAFGVHRPMALLGMAGTRSTASPYIPEVGDAVERVPCFSAAARSRFAGPGPSRSNEAPTGRLI